MLDEQVSVDYRLLGEQIDKLAIGSTGRRADDGSIAAVLGEEGHIFYGPYLTLPPGPYSVRMIFSAEMPEEEAEDPGIVLETLWGDRIIASLSLDEASLEAGIVALPFNVPAGGAVEAPKLEIRVYSRGISPLTVTSIDLRRINSAFRRFTERKGS